jgi:hypothetical protein
MQAFWFSGALLSWDENLIGNYFICEAGYLYSCPFSKLAWSLQKISSRTFKPICECILGAE